MHKRLKEFKFQPEPTIDYGVSLKIDPLFFGIGPILFKLAGIGVCVMILDEFEFPVNVWS